MLRSNFEDLRRAKSLREKRNISSRQVATETGLSRGTIDRIKAEHPERFDAQTLKVLCDYFGVPLGVLLEVEGTPKMTYPTPKNFIYEDGEGLSITIQSEKDGDPTLRDIWTDAVISLIEGADLHGWQKDELKFRAKKVPFEADVLSALARLYARDVAASSGDDSLTREPVESSLIDMIEWLKGEGYLKEAVGK